MTDPEVVKVRMSGTDPGRLADAIAALDGWTVLERTASCAEHGHPRECVDLTVLSGYPSVVQVHAWLAANGWRKLTTGPAGSLWDNREHRVGVPDDDSDERFTRSALERIAAAEDRPLHEVLTEMAPRKGEADG